MTVKGIRQTITATPFGSEGGMSLKLKNGEDIITLPINERVSWLNREQRIDGHIYSENQLLVEDGDVIKTIKIDDNATIAYHSEQTGKEEKGILVIIENNFDIKYSAMDIQSLHSNLYLSCFIPENGKLGSVKLLSGRTIEISPCSGMIDGLGFQILAKQVIELERGLSQKRIDSIVLRKDQVNRKISIQVLKGVPSNSPKPRALQRDKFSTYEMLICTIVVDKNANEVSPDLILDKRITLDNYYGADYVIETYQDLVNLTGNKTARNIILMSDIDLDNEDKLVNGIVEISDVIVNIPETIKTFRSLNNSSINGVITFNGGKIENVTFIGSVTASNTRFENCLFGEKDESTNIIKSNCKCNFLSSCYVNDGLIGEIRAFAGETGKTPRGWLLCNGITINRNEYSALFSVIGTNWGVGDGKDTFNIPDGRSGVLKGAGLGILNDPDAGGRFSNNGGNAGDKVGSYQRHAFQFQNTHHSHSTQEYLIDVEGHSEKRSSAAVEKTAIVSLKKTNSQGTWGVDLQYGTGNSTRDNNIAVNFIIKAK